MNHATAPAGRQFFNSLLAALICEVVETLGPPGALPTEEAVLALDGPEPVHEAGAIVAALRKMFSAARTPGS